MGIYPYYRSCEWSNICRKQITMLNTKPQYHRIARFLKWDDCWQFYLSWWHMIDREISGGKLRFDQMTNLIISLNAPVPHPRMHRFGVEMCAFLFQSSVSLMARPIAWSPAQSPASFSHDDAIKWKHFPRSWPFVRGIHRSRWIPHTKASDAELWCFLWSVSE